MELPDDKVIKSLQVSESYLGSLDVDRFAGGETKLKVSKEYFRRLKKVKVEWWEYSSRSQHLDRKTRKLFKIHRGLHPKSNVD